MVFRLRSQFDEQRLLHLEIILRLSHTVNQRISLLAAGSTYLPVRNGSGFLRKCCKARRRFVVVRHVEPMSRSAYRELC